jgi:hypothetical protein
MSPRVSRSPVGNTALVVTSPGMSAATAAPESAIAPDKARIATVPLDIDGLLSATGPGAPRALPGP